MTEYEKFLARFVQQYENQKKIVAVICGGGVSFSRIAMTPGSSKILDAIWMPYSEEETISWLENRNMESTAFQNAAVGGWAAKELWDALDYIHKEKSLKLSITAALTTNRPRKGDNRAYIGVEREFNTGAIYKLSFDKLPEEIYTDSIVPWAEQKIFNKRKQEDEMVAMVAVKLLTGFEKETLQELYDNGQLEKVL
jgi:nicotinamide mononucleotide (NMN) deamidase PncC